MADEIKPALTADGWRFVHSEPIIYDKEQEYPSIQWYLHFDGTRHCRFNDEYDIPLSRIPAEIAALNDALPDLDPMKFTREDAALVKEIADSFDGTLGAKDDDDTVSIDYSAFPLRDWLRLVSLAARISALLPPED